MECAYCGKPINKDKQGWYWTGDGKPPHSKPVHQKCALDPYIWYKFKIRK